MEEDTAVLPVLQEDTVVLLVVQEEVAVFLVAEEGITVLPGIEKTALSLFPSHKIIV